MSRATRPNFVEFFLTSTARPLSTLSSSDRESSIPCPLNSFTPENSGGLCEAVTEKPMEHILPLAPKAVTGVGTRPKSNASLPVELMAAGIDSGHKAQVFLPPHPTPSGPLSATPADGPAKR